jgi:hypothetical protein
LILPKRCEVSDVDAAPAWGVAVVWAYASASLLVWG